MTRPLALVVYEKLMPGSQLVNRLRDLDFRVQPLTDANQLRGTAKSEGPMLIFADLEWSHTDMCAIIANLRRDPDTNHIPILAFADESAEKLQTASRKAGATVAVSNTALLTQLPHLLEEALRLE